MWTTVDNSLSRALNGGKPRRESVDNDCGQMCRTFFVTVNLCARISLRRPPLFSALERRIPFQICAREVTDFGACFMSIECRQSQDVHKLMWRSC